MEKYIKVLIAFVLVIFCCVGINKVSAVEVSIDDVNWAWETIEHNAKTYFLIDPHFETLCNNNSTISEYLNRCHISVGDFAFEQRYSAYEMMENIAKNIDGRKVLTLKDLLNAITAKDIKNLLLVETFINHYKTVVGSYEDDTSELVTKKKFEELLTELNVDSARKEELRTSFAQMYYVQQQFNKKEIQNIIKDWMIQTEDPQQQYNGGFLIKDSAIYKLIYETNVSINNATPYNKLGDSASINTADEYDEAYTYFFALSTLSKNDVKKYIGNYIEMKNMVTKINDKWESLYKYREFTFPNSGDYWVNVGASSNWYMTIELDDKGIKKLDEFSTNEKIIVDNNTSITDVTNNTIENVVAGRVHLASMLYTRGYKDSEYSINLNGEICNNRSNRAEISIAGLMNDIKQYNQNTMYKFSNGWSYFYFCKNTAKNKYLLTLPKKDFNRDGYEDNPLGWFYLLLDEIEPDTKFGVVGLPGEYDKDSKTFIYDLESEKVYFAKINSSGSSATLYDRWLMLEMYDEYADLENSEILEVQTVKIRQKTNITHISFESKADLEQRFTGLINNMGSGDLYYKLQSDTSVKTAQNNINEVIDQLNKYIDYETITIQQMKLKKAELLSGEGIDYSSLKYCPDEVDVSAICKDDWWGCAFQFLEKGDSNKTDIGNLKGLNDLQALVFDIGNIIFIVVTAFLGVKYIWGGADSKFSVKNSIVTLVVAAIVFYGWNAVTTIFNVQELLTGSQSAGGYQNFATTIYNTIMYIVNIAAIGGIIYIGIKYMMAGADGKAEMKLKMIPVIMGIIMVYGTLNLINFILDIVYTF